MISGPNYSILLRRDLSDPILNARDEAYPTRSVLDSGAMRLADGSTIPYQWHSGFSTAPTASRHFIEVACAPRKLHCRAFRRGQAQTLRRMLAELERACAVCGIIGSCSGRIKSFSSTCRKMQVRGISHREVFDSIGLRVIVSRVEDCYRLLKHIRTNHAQIDSRVRDYIASPKCNGYQSLHVTVVNDDGSWIEIQLRTAAMHEVAERGTAAHAQYKATNSAEFLRTPEVVASARVAPLAGSPAPKGQASRVLRPSAGRNAAPQFC